MAHSEEVSADTTMSSSDVETDELAALRALQHTLQGSWHTRVQVDPKTQSPFLQVSVPKASDQQARRMDEVISSPTDYDWLCSPSSNVDWPYVWADGQAAAAGHR